MFITNNSSKTGLDVWNKAIIRQLDSNEKKNSTNSHEAVLTYALKFSDIVQLELLNGNVEIGIIARHDPDSITIGKKCGRKITYFKHSILSFDILLDHPEVDSYRERNKPKKKHHELVLSMAIKAQKNIYIVTVNGNQHSGLLNQFDKYTITIEKEDGCKSTIFKHAIHSFELEHRIHE